MPIPTVKDVCTPSRNIGAPQPNTFEMIARMEMMTAAVSTLPRNKEMSSCDPIEKKKYGARKSLMEVTLGNRSHSGA